MDNKKKFVGPMTLEERNSLSKFQDMLDEKDIDYDDYDENYLIRFLRARKLDLNLTYKMFTDFLEWRKKEDIDSILTYQFEEINEIKKVLPMCFHKTDKLGRPLFYTEVDLEKIFKVIDEKRLSKFFIKEFENVIAFTFPACSVATNKFVSNACCIIDFKITGKVLEGKQLAFIKLFATIGQSYYPEILGTMFMINTLPFVIAIWTIIKGFLEERTRNKIFIIGEDYKKNVLELAPEENIPSFLGGTCKCEKGCLYSNAGPWNPDSK